MIYNIGVKLLFITYCGRWTVTGKNCSIIAEIFHKEFKGIKKGGGSDAAYTVMAGAPTLCSCAIEGGGAHTLSEKADLSTLEERACLICDTIKALQEQQ